jgi:hypothetical protein
MPHETVVQRWDDDTVLVDLGGPEVAPVEPRPSVWPALALAVFTLLTGAGLAMSTQGSRPGDHGVRPAADSSATTSEANDRRPRAAPPGPPTPAELAGSFDGPVAAQARAVRAADGHWAIRLSGIAARDVASIEVRVLVGGAVVGQAAGRIDPAVALDPVDGRPAGDIAPWSADIPLATKGTIAGGDAVATVEVQWSAGSERSGTVAGLVVTLGDGRAAG